MTGAGRIPASLGETGAWRLWVAVVLTGLGTGAGTAALLLLLDLVQHAAWPGPGTLLDAARRADAVRHLMVLLAAGLLVGLAQWTLSRLTSGNATDINEAIWFRSGRLPARRTVGSAILSVSVVGMGASLGREGAPKQAGAVIGDACADRFGMPDAQRRLLVACGAGAGMAAAYGVPLGGALFAIEVLRGTPSLRLVLPAFAASAIATSVSFLALPDRPTYAVAAMTGSAALVAWALPAGLLIGLCAVGFVRAVAWTDRNRPRGRWRLMAPAAALLVLGAASIRFPALLGNGKDLSALAFDGRLGPGALLALLALKPAATLLCLVAGVPGGLFTPSLTIGALLGGMLGALSSLAWPGVAAPGAFALVGAGAFVAATTQGPISSVVLLFELTGLDRALAVPILVALVAATLVARSIDPRSIYDARLSDEAVRAHMEERERPFR